MDYQPQNPLAKLNVMITAQEIDVLFNTSTNTARLPYRGLPYWMIAKRGVLAPDVEALTKESTIGGETFAVFYPGGQSDPTAVWMYNKKLLSDAGIVVPDTVTLDDYTSILYAIKEAYPDKIALTTVGSTIDMFLGSMQNIYGAYGIANAFRVTENNELEFTGTTEDMRECLAYIRKLYADGILDPEYLVNTKDTIVPKIMNDQVVSVNAMV